MVGRIAIQDYAEQCVLEAGRQKESIRPFSHIVVDAVLVKLVDPHFLNSVRQNWSVIYKNSGAKKLNDQQWIAAFSAVETAVVEALQ